jgi:glycopeptide antibiotics resistance protein
MMMFVPVGFLAPVALAWRYRRTVLFSLLFSLAIEASQLALMRGSCELSDLIINIVGASLGYGFYSILRIESGYSHRHLIIADKSL